MYIAGNLRWDLETHNNYFMLANTMSVAAFERLWAAARRATGHSHTDSWETGERQAQLIHEAQNDRLPPTTIQRIMYMRSQPVIRHKEPNRQSTPRIRISMGITRGDPAQEHNALTPQPNSRKGASTRGRTGRFRTKRERRPRPEQAKLNKQNTAKRQ